METKRAARLPALRRSCALFVRFLIAEEVRAHHFPLDGARKIGPVLHPTSLDHGPFFIAEANSAGLVLHGISNPLDEIEGLRDGQPGDVDGWRFHIMNLCAMPREDNTPQLAPTPHTAAPPAPASS